MTPPGSEVDLRIGVRLPQYASTWPELRDAALRAEQLGFAHAWLNDHLWTPGRLHADDAFDAFTGLSALAASTQRIGLGIAVMSASYRPPALAAKMAAVLDVIAGGRLLLGLGTGSDVGEHTAYGYPFPPPAERTAHMLQALEVIQAMWAQPDGATIDGLLHDAPCNPPTATHPHPPVLVAAHKPRLLRIAGATADGIFAAFLHPDDLAARVAIAQEARDEAGVTDALRVATYLYAMPVRSRDEALEWIAPEARALDADPAAHLRWLEKKGLVGPPDQIAERLMAYGDAGATDAILVMPNRVPPEALDALADVLPADPGGQTPQGDRPHTFRVTHSGVSVTHNLVDLLVEQHRRDGRGGHAAVSDEGGTRTFDELGADLRRAAGALGVAGLRRGGHVAVAMRDGRPWVQAVLGIAAAGGVAIPLDPATEPELLAQVLDDAAAEFVVADEPMPTGPWRVLHPDALDAGRPVGITPVDPDDLAYMVFSSGSTGRPKGAMHAHRDMRVSVEGYSAQVLQLGPGDICHAVSRGYTSLGFGNGFFRPLGCGAHLVHTRTTPNVRTVLHACERHGVTVLSGVPTFWAQLAEFATRHPDAVAGLGTVRLGVSSGDSLPGPVLERLADALPGLAVLEGFGCSETSNIVLSTRPGDHLPGRLGRAVPGSEVSLRDDDGMPVPKGTPGRLWIRSDSNTSGYWRRSETTRDLVYGEWVRMTDMLVEEDDGVFRHVGRADDLFKVDARFVSPVQVEGVMLHHPAVAEVAVVGRPDARGLTQPVAITVAMDGVDGPAAEADIRAQVAHQLGAHCAPAAFEWVPELPRLASGKVNRRALRQPT